DCEALGCCHWPGAACVEGPQVPGECGHIRPGRQTTGDGQPQRSEALARGRRAGSNDISDGTRPGRPREPPRSEQLGGSAPTDSATSGSGKCVSQGRGPAREVNCRAPRHSGLSTGVSVQPGLESDHRSTTRTGTITTAVCEDLEYILRGSAVPTLVET